MHLLKSQKMRDVPVIMGGAVEEWDCAPGAVRGAIPPPNLRAVSVTLRIKRNGQSRAVRVRSYCRIAMTTMVIDEADPRSEPLPPQPLAQRGAKSRCQSYAQPPGRTENGGIAHQLRPGRAVQDDAQNRLAIVRPPPVPGGFGHMDQG